MLWCGTSWVKRLQFWLNLGGGESAAREGLVFLLDKKYFLFLFIYFVKTHTFHNKLK